MPPPQLHHLLYCAVFVLELVLQLRAARHPLHAAHLVLRSLNASEYALLALPHEEPPALREENTSFHQNHRGMWAQTPRTDLEALHEQLHRHHPRLQRGLAPLRLQLLCVEATAPCPHPRWSA